METISLRKGIAVCLILLFLGISIPTTQATRQGTPQPISYEHRSGTIGFHIVVNGTMGAHGWYISFPTITLSFDNGTIPMTILYALDGDMFVEYTAPFMITSDGIHSVVFQVIDQNGTMFTDSCTIKIDTTPPVVILAIHTKLIKITISASVYDNTSGMWYAMYYVDGFPQYNITNPPYLWIWKGYGNHSITVRAVDMAGLYNIQRIPYIPPWHFPRLHDLLIRLLALLRQ
jgi:hypothetical protein